jgi:uncharacterized membrane protein YfcA
MLLVVGSTVAGIINVLAGNGSAITLPLLSDILGLPIQVANGSNRLGILSQSLVGSSIYLKRYYAQIKPYWWLVTPACVGALIGSYTATQITPALFHSVYRYVLLVLLVSVLFKPERWLKPRSVALLLTPWLWIPVMCVIGFYGGFIQLGFGPLLLAALVPLGGIPMQLANGIKLVTVVAFTTLIIFVFARQGQIHWIFGLLVAFGQGIGGWLGARFGVRFSQADLWSYRLLVVIILSAIVHQFWPF